jgi:tryptophan synthase beta subunit
MGMTDVERQSINVERMKLLGAIIGTKAITELKLGIDNFRRYIGGLRP